MKVARFEVVRTDAGHHARFRAANGRVQWVTEVYTRRGAATSAIENLSGTAITRGVDGRDRVRWHANQVLEVRDVDEREPTQ